MIKIRALILAAGYATRLYPLTLNKPKPLLKVGGKPIIEHLLQKIEEIKEIDTVYVVTNNRFYSHFKTWAESVTSIKQIEIINDGTTSNEDRLGSIGDLYFTLKQEKIAEDLLVIAGDNLFGFSLQKFIDFFQEKNSSLVAFRDLGSIEKVRKRYGVGILNGSRVIDFEEKPAEPKSSLAATACYIFSRSDLTRVKELVEAGNADAPGNLIKYLAQKTVVHGFVFDDYWYDIGSFEALTEAEKQFAANNS